jgi:hypothetical protein
MDFPTRPYVLASVEFHVKDLARSTVHFACAGGELPLPSRSRHQEVSGDLPRVTPFILNHAATVAIGHVRWLFQGACTSLESQPVRVIGVVDVDVQKGGHRFADSGVANHYYRVADLHLGW